MASWRGERGARLVFTELKLATLSGKAYHRFAPVLGQSWRHITLFLERGGHAMLTTIFERDWCGFL